MESRKKIVIIGAGMGGLASGIYAQSNGYDSEIFEMHTLPGGQCSSWKRKGYTFDACIHHLFGCSDFSKIHGLWKDLGAMPRELVHTEECVSVLSPDGKIFYDYYDLKRLEEHLLSLSPDDRKTIEDYIKSIKAFTKRDAFGDMILGTNIDKMKSLPTMIANGKHFKTTMEQYAGRFKDGFLKDAFRLLVYSAPEIPIAIHLVRHGLGAKGSIAWPVGGAYPFAKSIEVKYKDLGGKVHYNSRVKRILTENNKAVGIELSDGAKHYADIVISNADGRKTIMEMLEGKYIDEKIKGYCQDPDDISNWTIHVFLGVDKDLSSEPSSMVMLLDKPIVIADHTHKSLEMQMYGFDKTMAPPGKGVIKVELVSSYSFWKKLYEDKEKYYAEKDHVAKQVIAALDRNPHFKGIAGKVEVIDVPTIMTWERYMGGTHGFCNMPKKKMDISSAFGKYENRLPGLGDFYFAGNWATSTGALFSNALSGKKAIEDICKKDGKRFMPPPEKKIAK